MSALLPYLGLFGPISVCIAAIFWLFVMRFAGSRNDVVSHERQNSPTQIATVSRI